MSENIIMKEKNMKKSFFIIMLILVVITIIVAYAINTYRFEIESAQKLNNQYKEYYNMQVLGTELISLINRTIDINEKNEIPKNTNNYYIDNGENSIEVYVKFIYKSETKTIQMEDIQKSGIESFVQMYSTASFKCTKIEYHSKTNNVKSVTFEEINENN